MPDFSALLFAALCWFAIHPGIAGSPARPWLVAKIGDSGFRGLFSLLSVAALAWLVFEYSRAAFYPLWFVNRGTLHLPLLVVPLAFVLLVGAFTVPNPTAVAGERALSRSNAARGVLRITRHPFLWAVVLWSLAHGLVNGDVAALLFFGSLGLTAFVGTFDIDRKRRRSNPDEWAEYAAMTSSIPFVAVARGRNKLAWKELLVPLIGAAVLTLLTLHFHARLFGVSPFPVAR